MENLARDYLVFPPIYNLAESVVTKPTASRHRDWTFAGQNSAHVDSLQISVASRERILVNRVGSRRMVSAAGWTQLSKT
jgi:hypothetical protein